MCHRDDGTNHAMQSRDEGFDANDHVELIVPTGSTITWGTEDAQMMTEVMEDEQLLTIMIPTTSIKKGVDPQKYYSVLQHIQKVTAGAMHVVANWSDADKAAMLKQTRLVQLVCCVLGACSARATDDQGVGRRGYSCCQSLFYDP